jgi:macrolide transport system ATP-binding/permease protein
VIRLTKLRKVYRSAAGEVAALDDIYLEIERGEFVAVTGPSGCGKSTLLQILGLLDHPSSGKYELDGRDASQLSEDEQAEWRAEKLGFVFQFFNLLPRATAVENVELPLVYAGQSEREEKARAALVSVGLADRAEHWPSQLSGGQQQRVAIARAVVGKPLLLLADEPTGNLSTEQSLEVMALLKSLHEKGLTIVLVTHEKEIAAFADREIQMRDGKIVSDRTVRALKAPPPRSSDDSHPRASARIEENLAMAFDALTAHPLRTALAALGIVIGVASLVAMMAVGGGARV